MLTSANIRALFKNSRDHIKKILFIVITFSSYLLVSSVFVHSLSLLLSQKGAESLPVMMILVHSITSLFLLGNVMLAKRFPITKMFAITLVAFTWIYGITYLIRANTELNIVLYFLASNVLLIVLDISLPKFILSLMNPIQGKSFLPVIYTFNSLGFMMGSFLADKFQKLHENMGIGSIPAIGMAIILILVLIIGHMFRKQIASGFGDYLKSGLDQSIKASYKFVFSESKLFKSLCGIIFLYAGVQTFVDFKFKTVLSTSYPADQLTSILGLIYTVESAMAILVSMFLARTLYFKFGIMNIISTLPFITMAALGIAVANNLQPLFVIPIYLAFGIPYYSTVIPAISQIFALVPKHLNESVYFFVRGVMQAIFMICFSVILLIYSMALNLERTVNTTVLGIFLILLSLQLWKFRKQYQNSIKENLLKTDKFLKEQAIDLLAEKNQKEKGERYLRQLLSMQSVSDTTKQKALYSLGLIGNADSLIDIINVMKNSNPRVTFAAIQAISMINKNKNYIKKFPVTKQYLLQSLEQMLVSDQPEYIKKEIITSLKNYELEDVFHFFGKALKSEDESIKENTLETIGTFNERAIIAYLLPSLSSQSIRMKCAAINGLWKFEDMRLKLINELAALSIKKGVANTECVIRLMGKINAKWEKKYVMNKIGSKNFATHVQAVVALIRMNDMSYIDELLALILETSLQKDKDKIEYLLAEYRQFEKKVKNKIIEKIQNLDNEKVQIFLKLFEESKFTFDYEINQLV